MHKSIKRTMSVVLAVLCMLYSVPQTVFTSAETSIKYEAENATLNGTKVTNDSSASGGKCVGRFEKNTDTVTFNVSVTNSGYYDITICSKGIGGTKYNNLYVNGANSGQFSSDVADAYSEYTMQCIYLESGSNSIKITKSWGWIYLDYITVTPWEAPTDAYNVSKTLVNKNASDGAKRLMSFLVDNYGKNVITGQQGDNGYSSSEVNAIYNATGKRPALIGLDLLGYSQSNVTQHGTNGKSINIAKNVYDAGGIVSMCWHWRMYDEYLLSGRDDNGNPRWWQAFYTKNIDLSKFDLSAIMNNPNSTTYKQILSDIDFVAEKMKTLNDMDIPVLFRPLHEASGGWFWWGSDGPEPYIKLWRLMYDRLTNYHGLNNLIWVWNGQAKAWYPGDEYCDIVGTDIYNSAYEYSPLSSDFAKCLNYSNGSKMVTLSENGVLFDIDKALQAKTLWSWFCVWGGSFAVNNNSISTQYTQANMWTKVYQHENAITLDELPDLKSYPIDSDPEPTAVLKYQLKPDDNGTTGVRFILVADEQEVINADSARLYATISDYGDTASLTIRRAYRSIIASGKTVTAGEGKVFLIGKFLGIPDEMIKGMTGHFTLNGKTYERTIA